MWFMKPHSLYIHTILIHTHTHDSLNRHYTHLMGNNSKLCVCQHPKPAVAQICPTSPFTCTDLYDVMKGSMRWKPGPLVEVRRAPPL